MRVIRKTTMDRVFNKLYRDLGLEEIAEDDVIEWTGEVLEHIGVVNMLEQHVAFIEVSNHRADIPPNLVSIIQIARNRAWDSSKSKKGICIEDVIPTQVIDTDPGCIECSPNTGDLVPLDCRGGIIGDYKVAYYRPYFDLQYEYYNWNISSLYVQQFTPVRLSNKTFFNSIVCEEDERIYINSQDEYTINGDSITFSFKDGQIALAYYSMPLDPETGYPMIPDNVSVIQAITSYITYKYMQRLWYLGREGYTDKYQQAQQDYNWYISQAKNALFGPYGIDDFQNLLEQGMSLLPNLSKYRNFFSGDNYKDMLRRRVRADYGR